MSKKIRTPKGMRLHIGIFGRRNVGKSTVLNALTNQNVSIVSNQAGTTTDPVEKPMELLPLGPVIFIDTAGIDDEGDLGELRIQKSMNAVKRTDIGIIVSDSGKIEKFEQRLITIFKEYKIPFFIIFNKSDLQEIFQETANYLENEKISYVKTGAKDGIGINLIKNEIIKTAPEDYLAGQPIAGDLVPPGETAILVVPIDKEAPKGRLILPQVQTIRDLLDSDTVVMVVKERELSHALDNLKRPPALVITDSQAFLKVAADTPDNIPITSFSILFARLKGDLATQVKGTFAIDTLENGDKILVAEACTHHPIGEDIGRVKIPRWITSYSGKDIIFDTVQGHDFPPNLKDYKLVIHCGACMFNKKAVLSRILECSLAGVPITNYGLIIAKSLGILKRVLKPFPAAYNIFEELDE
ncbi:MAG: [FeFe] hydrogenase H-cluster maturation GTPase HydF [Deltaproteobacteria bacterium]|nr:[FeFe] hydrogenase H-cluster maturation GTPase HydF [Deltaproteobacteria bacterium]